MKLLLMFFLPITLKRWVFRLCWKVSFNLNIPSFYVDNDSGSEDTGSLTGIGGASAPWRVFEAVRVHAMSTFG